MSRTITFRDREFKGSRLRCLLATHCSREKVARFLNELAGDTGFVSVADEWYPKGFLWPDEARLDKAEFKLLDCNKKMTDLKEWWLKNHKGANTPNWDIVSTCLVEGVKGLLLVEAKAHCGELKDDYCKAPKNKENYKHIGKALLEASKGWDQFENGFHLGADNWYQLSNRFAFAWKLATMGIPAILVYLGFLNADEMEGQEILRNTDQWRSCVHEKSKAIVPVGVWDQTFHVNGTPLSVLIRTADVQIEIGKVGR